MKTEDRLRDLERRAASEEEARKELQKLRAQLGICEHCGGHAEHSPLKNASNQGDTSFCWADAVNRKWLPWPGGRMTWRDSARLYVAECLRRAPPGMDTKEIRTFLTKHMPNACGAGGMSWPTRMWQQECRLAAEGVRHNQKPRRRLPPPDPRQGQLFVDSTYDNELNDR